MASVINTNIAATRTHNVYNRNNEFMNAAMTRVATGMKINSAKDGASTWAISEKMRERMRANDQANQNVQNDTAMLKVAQGGIGNTIDILKTLKERAINGLNDSNINSDRSNIATEVYQLVSQIDDNAAKVKFNGRVLLNGDSDKTVGVLDTGVEETSDTEETSAITAPTAADNPTAKGTNAVYKLVTDGAIYGANDGTTAANGTTALTSLYDKDGNQLFKDGDQITFTWNEDDEAKQKTVEVTTSNTLADLATAITGASENVSMSFVAASAAIKDADGNDVKDSGGTAQTASANEGGLYLVGKKGVEITDLAVAVTYDNDGTKTTRTEAQDAVAFTGVQQATAPTTGSHTVYGLGSLTDGTNAITADTLAKDVTNSDSETLVTNGKSLSIKFGDTELYSVSAANGNFTSVKIGDIANAFNTAAEAADLDIRMVIAEDGAEITDGDGNAVTQNTLDGTQNLKSTGAGIYFVGKAGEDLSDKLTITTNGTTFGGDTDYEVEKMQKAVASDTEDTTDTTTAASTNVTFHIGGEDGFNMDVSIKAMNMQTLFGTDEKKFAKMFLSTDDLKKGDGTNSVVAMIDKAISTALNEQTKLGAIESRLGYTSDNLTTMNENLEAADSVMRDSDIAKEMTSYMKYAVLSQASQYMLAQAGQNAFQVLNLLQQ